MKHSQLILPYEEKEKTIVMNLLNLKSVSMIDRLILIFSIVFLLSATNSIFINQIGYYGTLLALLLKYFIERRNPFSKTGLEVAILLFFGAELLSTIFSLDKGEALHNMVKKFLLIPTLYTFIAASKDFNRTKQFAIVYLGAATLTLIYYLVRSYDYIINNLYQLKASGPSVFQYPITSSELMAFSVVILFAFLINEKSNFKQKFLILVLFAINLLALIATYKRTGWIGAAAGMLIIIILSRKWFLLTAVAILIIAVGLMSKKVSDITIYDYTPPKLNQFLELSTNGRAYNIFSEGEKIFISDFDNGLVMLKDSSLTNKCELPAPIVDFKKWRDDFYIATLVDTRFILLKSDDADNFQILSEFYTQSLPLSNKIANDMFYVLCEDSSLVIYKNPTDLNEKVIFSFENSMEPQNFFVDSSYCVVFSKDKHLSIYSLINYLPEKIVLKEKLSEDDDLIGFIDKKLLFNSEDGLKIFSFDSNKLNLIDVNGQVGNTLFLIKQNDLLFSCNSNGELFELDYPIHDKLKIKSSAKLNKVPSSITFSSGKIYSTYAKAGRLYSFIDPYYATNYSRLAFWRAGLKIFSDYPILGVGDMDLAKLYRIYKRPYDREIQGHLHNNFFHSLATLGVVGFLAIMFLLIKIFLVHLKMFNKLKNIPFASSFSLGALGGFVSFIAAGLTEYNIGDHEVITLVWFTLAISIAFSKSIEKEEAEVKIS